MALSLIELVIFLQITLGEDEHQRLGLEEGLDGGEKRNLLVNGVATGLRDIEKEENGSV